MAEFTVLTPFPHTRTFDDLHNEGRIFSYDWNDYTCGKVVFQPKLMTPGKAPGNVLLLPGISFTRKNRKITKCLKCSKK